MKVAYISDTHMDGYSKNQNDKMMSVLVKQIKEEKPDVIIHAGDIYSYGIEDALPDFVRPLRAYSDAPVIFVPGNHEFWSGYAHHDYVVEMNKNIDENTFILQNESIVIDGVRFLGSTLWTEAVFKEEVTDVEIHFRGDFNYIKSGRFYRIDPKLIEPKMLTINEWREENHFSKHWLDRTMRDSEEPCFVVSHYLPSIKSVHEQFVSHPMTPMFTSDLEYMIQKREPLFWIHGHTHSPANYSVGKTRILCNPRGYPSEENESEFRFIEVK